MSKSNHKHDYEIVKLEVNDLVIYTKRHMTFITSKCSLCNKEKFEVKILTSEQISNIGQ